MTRDDLLTILRSLTPGLRERYAVASLGVFGSFARGDDDSGSDVDVFISFRPGTTVTLFTLAGIKCELEDALGREIDLVEDHPRLREAFRASVERDLIRVA